MANYMDSEARAEDNRTSAWILLIVGGVGIVGMVLGLLGIIPMPMSGFSKYMFCGVMGVLCIAFVIAGIVSVKKTKVYASAASIEKNQKQQIIDWCKESDIVTKINESLGAVELSEEEKYFRRAERLKQAVAIQFPEIGYSFLDHVTDDLYDTLFED